MKRFLLIGLFCITAICCTGCLKVSYNIEIDNKDNVSISQTQAYNLEMLKSLDPNIDEKFAADIEEKKAEFESKGYETAMYKDDKYTGLTLTKDKITFKNAASELPDNIKNGNENAFSVKKGLFQNTYKIHLIVDGNNVVSGAQSEGSGNTNQDDNIDKVVSKTKTTDDVTGETIETTVYESGAKSTVRYNPEEQKQFGNAMGEALSQSGMEPELSLTIKIPKKAISHNATKTISDTEYQWNLAVEKQPVEINIEYTKSNTGTIIGGIAALLVLLLIFGITKQKQNPQNSKYTGSISGF